MKSNTNRQTGFRQVKDEWITGKRNECRIHSSRHVGNTDNHATGKSGLCKLPARYYSLRLLCVFVCLCETV